jgi:hypothetical protein
MALDSHAIQSLFSDVLLAPSLQTSTYQPYREHVDLQYLIDGSIAQATFLSF